MDDAALLRRYAEQHSENAFAELVRRYAGLVYGTALRRVAGDVHLAEDITQMAFTALARDAVRLSRHPNLIGWLFTTTRFLAAKTVRSEQRRHVRERVMAAATDEPANMITADSAEIAPMLDEVMMELRELDRQMLLMRFYGGLRLTEIAARMNSSENAVQKRIERALDRLNALLVRRGITSTAAALAFALEHQAAVPLPAGLVAASTTAGISAGGVGIAPASGIAVVFKLQIAAAALLAGAGSVGAVWYFRERTPPREVPPQTAYMTAARQEPAASDVPPAETTSIAPAVAPPSRRVTPLVASPDARALPPPAPAGFTPTVATPPGAGNEMIPLRVEYPRPLFAGTPRPIRVPNLEAPPVGPRADFLVPAGTSLLSRGKHVTSSDSLPVIGELSYVTDGDKSGTDGTYLELGPNVQWIQIDLGSSANLAAIVAWHFHSQTRVYHDVVVQVSNDAQFRSGVVTLFNNDHDNTSRLGAGHDPAYLDTSQGRIFDARGTRARYVRLYSNGNTSDELNHYCEVEVYGKP